MRSMCDKQGALFPIRHDSKTKKFGRHNWSGPNMEFRLPKPNRIKLEMRCEKFRNNKISHKHQSNYRNALKLLLFHRISASDCRTTMPHSFLFPSHAFSTLKMKEKLRSDSKQQENKNSKKCLQIIKEKKQAAPRLCANGNFCVQKNRSCRNV